MNQQATTGKRIVSKREYVKAQGRRASKGLLGLCIGFVALLFALYAIFCCAQVIIALFYDYLSAHQAAGVEAGKLENALFCAFAAAVTGTGAYYMFWKSGLVLKTAAKIDPGVPLTRANTADLPAPESLVRASEEPMQAQEAVLLRAATAAVERHEEQLVRPVLMSE